MLHYLIYTFTSSPVSVSQIRRFTICAIWAHVQYILWKNNIYMIKDIRQVVGVSQDASHLHEFYIWQLLLQWYAYSFCFDGCVINFQIEHDNECFTERDIYYVYKRQLTFICGMRLYSHVTLCNKIFIINNCVVFILLENTLNSSEDSRLVNVWITESKHGPSILIPHVYAN